MIDTPAQREGDVAEKFDYIDTVASVSLPAKDEDNLCGVEQALVNVFLSL